MSRNRRSAANVPYRDSSMCIPHIKPSDERKVCFYEYGTEYDSRTGEASSVFVDIISGDSDLVDFVEIRFPSGETHTVHGRCPVVLSDGSWVSRFTLKRSSVYNFSRRTKIGVFGRGGSVRMRNFCVKPKYFRERPLKFLETRDIRSYYNEAPDINFGVEIEMSLEGYTTTTDVVEYVSRAGHPVVDLTGNYREGQKQYGIWKLVGDSSIACSRSNPNCNKFELVSPILNGEDGLTKCQAVLASVKRVGPISLNSSMALHVHISIEGLGLEHIKNICMNFIKYEREIDTFMPRSRSDEGWAGWYCKSNRKAILPGTGNGEKQSAIVACQTHLDLCDLLNPIPYGGVEKDARYYKLNLQNIRSGRQPTIEFRQHSGTGNFRKLEAWVRFCTKLVQNSHRRPQSLKKHDDPFELLFDTVIQDIKLKDFYRNRKYTVSEEDENYTERYLHANEKFHYEDTGPHRAACCDRCRR